MERDKHVAIVTDSGSSILPGSDEARELGVTVAPLNLSLWKSNTYISYSDADIKSKDFYDQMRTSAKLPITSGVITGPLTEIYKNLRENTESIMSIHITSKLSEVWGSAILAKNIVNEEDDVKIPIEIIDTLRVSAATRFAVEVAAGLSKKMANLDQIKPEVQQTIENSQLYVTLNTFENLIKGGRGGEAAQAKVASILQIFPIIGFENGKLKKFALARSFNKSREKMIEMVGDAGKLVRLCVIHTNAYPLAEKTRDALSRIYSGIIPIYEAGPVLAVHAGEGAVGIAFQKA